MRKTERVALHICLISAAFLLGCGNGGDQEQQGSPDSGGHFRRHYYYDSGTDSYSLDSSSGESGETLPHSGSGGGGKEQQTEDAGGEAAFDAGDAGSEIAADAGDAGGEAAADSGGEVDSGEAPADSGAGDAGGPYRPPCISKPSQVVIIGDSYINWVSHTLPEDLAQLAGETWRSYALPGASMATGGVATLIPDQFLQAVAEDPDMKMVLMDGGGNDILIPAATWPGGADCKNNADAPSIQVCRDIVETALQTAQDNMLTMVQAGVKDVLYFFYPHVPEGTLAGGLYPNAMLDYTLPKARALCENTIDITNGQMRCHFVDMVPVFEGHEAEYFAEFIVATDIHPNTTGSAAMADAIWSRMKADCIGQHASSGCCEP